VTGKRAFDQSRATEVRMLDKLRSMSRAHKEELTRMQMELDAAYRTIRVLKQRVESLEIMVRH
jgi:hypothetical protein